MDPAANIVEQRQLAALIIRIWDHADENGDLDDVQSVTVAESAYRLAELVEALHEWRQQGGYDPYTPAKQD